RVAGDGEASTTREGGMIPTGSPPRSRGGGSQSHGGWTAVSITGAIFGLAAVALAVWDTLRRRPAAPAG
ncbi:hypothetical protein FF36_06366, partial [Frankia torreyi]